MFAESAKNEPDATHPTTLRDLAEGAVSRQVDGVLCWCNRCAHNAVLPLAELIPRLGPDCPVPLIARRLVCSSCGSRDIDTRPAWIQFVDDPEAGKIDKDTTFRVDNAVIPP